MYSTVIVPLDGSPFAEQAIQPAAFVSQQSHAQLLLVRVHEGPRHGSYHAPTWDEYIRSEEEAYLEDVTTLTQATLTHAVDSALLDGPVSAAICARAEACPSSLLVMSTHGQTGLYRAWIGSVADEVFRNTSSPVLMVRPPIDDANGFSASTAPPFANVIVALDGSELAETILPHALSVAAASGARVLLLRVVEPVRAPLPALVGRDDPVTDRTQDTRDTAWRTASTYLNDVAAVVRDRHPSLDIDRELRFANSPGAAILKSAEAHERPLIALASHGRGLSRIFLGSVASAVVRGASAVLMCRARAV